MGSKNLLLASEFVLLLSLLLSAYYYSFLPSYIAVHWNLDGEPDSYLWRPWMLVFPAIWMVLILVIWLLPRIDPLRKNVERFRHDYDIFVFVLACFLAALQILILAYNLGWITGISPYVPVLVSFVLVAGGYLTYVSHPNWFIGFRTPWTLSSERVWYRVNRVAGLMMIAASIGSTLAFTFFGMNGFLAVIFALVGAFVALWFWSYLLYRGEFGG